MKYFDRDTLIFISGSNGVGKTTLAQKLLQKHTEFIVIQNIDILREIVRSTYRIFSLCNYDYQLLNRSASELTYSELVLQSELLMPHIISLCKRLQIKCIPAIIEGINICYESLFNNYEFRQFLEGNKNVVFVNLYLSNEQEHFEKIANRITDGFTREKQVKNFNNIRHNNDIMNMVVNRINEDSSYYINPIINIDVAAFDLNKQENIDRIISLIEINLRQ